MAEMPVPMTPKIGAAAAKRPISGRLPHDGAKALAVAAERLRFADAGAQQAPEAQDAFGILRSTRGDRTVMCEGAVDLGLHEAQEGERAALDGGRRQQPRPRLGAHQARDEAAARWRRSRPTPRGAGTAGSARRGAAGRGRLQYPFAPSALRLY